MFSLQGLIVGVTSRPSLPWTTPVYCCCPGITINGGPLSFKKCSGLGTNDMSPVQAIMEAEKVSSAKDY